MGQGTMDEKILECLKLLNRYVKNLQEHLVVFDRFSEHVIDYLNTAKI